MEEKPLRTLGIWLELVIVFGDPYSILPSENDTIYGLGIAVLEYMS